MKLFICVLVLLIDLSAFGQKADKLIADIQKAQKNLYAISYTLQRSDTFVTGDTRIIKGKAILKPLPQDSIFGFTFWAKRDDFNRFALYDGKMGYDVNDDTKQYDIHTGKMIPHILGNPGGQIIFEDLGRLDTTGAIRYQLIEDKSFFYLTLRYPDIIEYDVTHRYKTLKVDKKMLLPVAVRKYQETLGKVQHLNYEIKDLKLNSNALTYDFSTNPFLEIYTQEIPQINKALLSLKDKEAPLFELNSFTGSLVSLASLQGKVVLLDFWEVWCGPCIASMPKVQALSDLYKNKGLQVYGIINEIKELESAKRLVEKKQINFPMLIGNMDVKKSYKLNAVPLYILIDKKGKISFISEGYSDQIEEAIQKAIAE